MRACVRACVLACSAMCRRNWANAAKATRPFSSGQEGSGKCLHTRFGHVHTRSRLDNIVPNTERWVGALSSVCLMPTQRKAVLAQSCPRPGSCVKREIEQCLTVNSRHVCRRVCEACVQRHVCRRVCRHVCRHVRRHVCRHVCRPRTLPHPTWLTPHVIR